MIRFLSFFLILTSIVSADIAVPEESRTGLELTAYRYFGMITDIRKVQLPKGASRIRFPGVATEIQTSSVLLETLQKSKLDILGQSYEFDLVSPSKLMEKYIGKELEIIDQENELPDTTSRLAELISIHGEEPVFRIGTKITFGHIGQLLFPYMPDNLYTRPTLLWDLESQQRQVVQLTATYLTDSIFWNPEYKLLIDEKTTTAKLGCWITLSNKSGTDFKNAAITFVDGKIKRNREDKLDANLPDLPCFYSIKEPVNLLNNETKQIEWIEKSSIQIKKVFEIAFIEKKYTSRAAKVIKCGKITDKHFDFPLPDGTVQIFKQDSKSKKWFIGEDFLENIATNNCFSVKIGIDNDIIGHKSVLIKDKGRTEFVIEIQNKKDKPVEIKVKDFIDKRSVINSSEKYQLANSIIQWNVRVGAGGVKKMSYSLD